MKKEKKEILRLQNLIENDRLKLSGDFEEIIIMDIDRLLREYFDYKNYPTLTIIKKEGKFKVDINVCATRIKPFGVVAKM